MRKNYLNYYMLFKQKRNESFYLYIYTTQHNIECSENDEKKKQLKLLFILHHDCRKKKVTDPPTVIVNR